MTETIEEVEVSGVELEPVSDQTLFEVRDPVDRLAAAKRVAGALKAEIEAAGMVQRIGGREHVRIEGWQTLAAMAGLTTKIAWSRPIDDGWEARAEVITSDGRIIGAGESQCTRGERNWSRRDPYALRSMAQTRASSRALRGVLAFVMTLSGHDPTPAEEIDSEAVSEVPEPTLPEWARPAAVQPTAAALRATLAAAGVAEPAARANEIGQRVFDRCDRVVPQCVLEVLADIEATIAMRVPAESEEVGHD